MASSFQFCTQRRLQFNTTKPRLATSRATAVPYICLMVCCKAIRLLRDDPEASLVESLASSASCLISRKPCRFPRRSIVFESSSSKWRILHCTQNLGDKFASTVDTNGPPCSPPMHRHRSQRAGPILDAKPRDLLLSPLLTGLSANLLALPDGRN
jgi:hypothetical protein